VAPRWDTRARRTRAHGSHRRTSTIQTHQINYRCPVCVLCVSPVSFSRGCPTRRRGTFAPLPPARHGLAIAAVRRVKVAPNGAMQAVWRASASKQSLGRHQVAPQGRGLSAPAPHARRHERGQRSCGRAFRATRGARSEVSASFGRAAILAASALTPHTSDHRSRVRHRGRMTIHGYPGTRHAHNDVPA
jgi:hypothetical protein